MASLVVPRFAVRCEKRIKIIEMAELASRALGCRLSRGRFRDVPAMIGRLIGMTVGLYESHSSTGAIFRFEGDVDDYAYLDFLDQRPMDIESVDISQVIRDALIVISGFDWEVSDPTV